MVCPKCLSTRTSVTNSRKRRRTVSIWRRRQCDHCQMIFSTQERPDWTGITVIGQNKKRRTFSEAHLLLSLARACDHLDQPAETADRLTATVIDKLLPLTTPELKASEVIAAVQAVLKRYDMAAFVKYSANHDDLHSRSELRRHLRGSR